MIRRRDLLAAALAGGGLSMIATPFAGAATRRSRRARFDRNPFTLGVASGYPTRDGCVLWTRLAPDPLMPGSGMDPTGLGPDGLAGDIAVDWEIADDPGFARIRRRGRARAEAAFAHSVHLELRGLPAGREYFYRFRADDFESPVGRTWTAAPAGHEDLRLRIGVASCQHYEMGHYHAWTDMVGRNPDLVVHLGDYVYGGNADTPVRRHDAGECQTLAEYRLRHAWYRSDLRLQAAHAACPWIVTHDDHEVDKDYAGLQAEVPAEQAGFAARRAAAYQAYYEHLPLPRRAAPGPAGMRLHGTSGVGSLLALHVLDTRQYRSPQACPAPPLLGGSRVFVDECPIWNDPARTVLGAAQEHWIDAQLRASRARWNLLAQGVVFTRVDEDPGPRELRWNDGWAGYPAARERLLRSIADSGAQRPVILGGDIHAFIAADQRLGEPDLVPAEHGDGRAPIVASELVTTSITSNAPPRAAVDAYRRATGHVHFADGDRRGYLWLELSAARLEATMLGFDSVRETTAAPARPLAAFTIEADRPGLQNAAR
jgi:alkaline phosphatase D